MNGIQIERMLDLIDRNVSTSKEMMRGDILHYLQDHGDELVNEISEKGYGTIPTQLGSVTVTREDLNTLSACA